MSQNQDWSAYIREFGKLVAYDAMQKRQIAKEKEEKQKELVTYDSLRNTFFNRVKEIEAQEETAPSAPTAVTQPPPGISIPGNMSYGLNGGLSYPEFKGESEEVRSAQQEFMSGVAKLNDPTLYNRAKWEWDSYMEANKAKSEYEQKKWEYMTKQNTGKNKEQANIDFVKANESDYTQESLRKFYHTGNMNDLTFKRGEMMTLNQFIDNFSGSKTLDSINDAYPEYIKGNTNYYSILKDKPEKTADWSKDTWNRQLDDKQAKIKELIKLYDSKVEEYGTVESLLGSKKDKDIKMRKTLENIDKAKKDLQAEYDNLLKQGESREYSDMEFKKALETLRSINP